MQQGGAGSSVFWRLGYAIHYEVLARGEWLKTTQNEHVKWHVCTGRITQIDSKRTCNMADGRSEGQWLQGHMKVTTEINAAQRLNIQNEQTNCTQHGVRHCPAVLKIMGFRYSNSKWFKMILSRLSTVGPTQNGDRWNARITLARPDPTPPW